MILLIELAAIILGAAAAILRVTRVEA